MTESYTQTKTTESLPKASSIDDKVVHSVTFEPKLNGKYDRGNVTLTYRVPESGIPRRLEAGFIDAMKSYEFAAPFLPEIGKIRLYEFQGETRTRLDPTELKKLLPGSWLIVEIEGSGPLQKGLKNDLEDTLKYGHRDIHSGRYRIRKG